ncbi:DUF1206 domain-containing protein [Jannaschia donghaensis]|uniref:DUF1206 domain-containing protein n=1 Tax=Jannaschia donghaensis TaxID=420998 RepID=A0A0M6YP30_9RHOB|nr:DUF1206 domain-containing protein [Jannaschia donghaensis]CTQ50776.1 hypothetical protein JDO7802_02804 [Jannaschia donghaensis]
MADLKWTIPVMRAGYAGRGVTYLAVAGLSLWGIWQGGQAQGTSSALKSLSESTWGVAVLWLIAIGLFAYCIWRGIDAAEDLEDEGSDAKGMVARTGMIVTGLIHGALGALALSLALGLGLSSGGGESGGGGGGISGIVSTVLGWPGGAWIIGLGGLATIGAGIYYVIKGWKAKYRQKLRANHFTQNWDWALRAGVIAQGILIVIVGCFLVAAGLNGNPEEAGGMGKAFEWLYTQPFGKFLVIAICVGLLGFAFFCFVNAAYRIIPKVAGDDIETLGKKMKAKAKSAAA